MKKSLALSVLASLLLLSTDCISYHNNAQGSQFPTVETAPIRVQPVYEISDKPVTASVSDYVLLNYFHFGAENKFADRAMLGAASQSSDNPILNIFNSLNDNKLKQAALFKACQQAKCDNLASCKYDIIEEDYLLVKKVTVTLTGYPVFQKGIKRID